MIKDASTSNKLSRSERRAISSVVKFFGENGESGVRIEMTNRGGMVRGTASRWDVGTINITVEESGSDKDRARHVLHEGSHGLDDKIRGRTERSRGEKLDSELNAYTTQAYFQKAVEFSGGAGDVWLYKEGISQENIERYAKNSVDNSCGTSVSGSCAPGD